MVNHIIAGLLTCIIVGYSVSTEADWFRSKMEWPLVVLALAFLIAGFVHV